MGRAGALQGTEHAGDPGTRSCIKTTQSLHLARGADALLFAAQVRCEASGVLVPKDKAVRRFVVRASGRSACALRHSRIAARSSSVHVVNSCAAAFEDLMSGQ